MDLWFGLRIISLSLGIRIGLSNICMLFLDLLLESVGCMWWVFGIRQFDRDYLVLIVEIESFFNFEFVFVVRMN